MTAMTPEDEARLYELTKRIADEQDGEKLKSLSAELQRLLMTVGQVQRIYGPEAPNPRKPAD